MIETKGQKKPSPLVYVQAIIPKFVLCKSCNTQVSFREIKPFTTPDAMLAFVEGVHDEKNKICLARDLTVLFDSAFVAHRPEPENLIITPDKKPTTLP